MNDDDGVPPYLQSNPRARYFCIVCTHQVKNVKNKNKGLLMSNTLYNYFKTIKNPILNNNGQPRYLNAVHKICLNKHAYLPVL
jgi:hypothetical protein